MAIPKKNDNLFGRVIYRKCSAHVRFESFFCIKSFNAWLAVIVVLNVAKAGT